MRFLLEATYDLTTDRETANTESSLGAVHLGIIMPDYLSQISTQL